MPKIKYQATDSRGQVHKRSTTHRIYSHVVVAHIAAKPADVYWRHREAHSVAEWAGRLQLAENVARRWERSKEWRQDIEGVEILPAERVS